MNSNHKNLDKITQDCNKILKKESFEQVNKWLTNQKFTSYTLRNQKAAEVINISCYLLQKMLLYKSQRNQDIVELLVEYHKIQQKCFQYCRMLKHFSQWDYEFQYLFKVAKDEEKQSIGLYLRIREKVIKSEYNKSKKELLSGVSIQLQDWASIVRFIFKQKNEEEVIEEFTDVVKKHYLEIKKSQSQRINGAEFFKICQIMEKNDRNKQEGMYHKKSESSKKREDPISLAHVFDESLLKGLSNQDKQLIRILSYKDKNIARLLEQKHSKMVHLIGEEVDHLRKDIAHEKESYLEVIEEKKNLQRVAQRIKEATLRYIVNQNENNQYQVLQQLEYFNKKYCPKAIDVQKTIEVVNNRRLIELIQKEELQND